MTRPASTRSEDAVRHLANPIVAHFESERARAVAKSRFAAVISIAVVTALLSGAVFASGIAEQSAGADPLGRIASFLARMSPDLQADVLFEGATQTGSLRHWFYDLPRWLRAIFETLQMAILATAFGAAGAVALSTLASRTTMPFAIVRFLVRRLFEVLRTIPDIILATILVAAFGVGPLAGVIALTLSTIGSLGKLFTEVNENADPSAFEGVRAAGGGWAQELRYGLAPQVAPNYASYTLIRVEVNISLAAALGIVGAGGIGMELERAISFTEFDTYLAILLLILALITTCDLASEAIRRRLMGQEVRA